MAGMRRGIWAGGTGDLSGPVRDDVRHALAGQRRGGGGAGADERMRYPLDVDQVGVRYVVGRRGAAVGPAAERKSCLLYTSDAADE